MSSENLVGLDLMLDSALDHDEAALNRQELVEKEDDLPSRNLYSMTLRSKTKKPKLLINEDEGPQHLQASSQGKRKIPPEKLIDAPNIKLRPRLNLPDSGQRPPTPFPANGKPRASTPRPPSRISTSLVRKASERSPSALRSRSKSPLPWRLSKDNEIPKPNEARLATRMTKPTERQSDQDVTKRAEWKHDDTLVTRYAEKEKNETNQDTLDQDQDDLNTAKPKTPSIKGPTERPNKYEETTKQVTQKDEAITYSSASDESDDRKPAAKPTNWHNEDSNDDRKPAAKPNANTQEAPKPQRCDSINSIPDEVVTPKMITQEHLYDATYQIEETREESDDDQESFSPSPGKKSPFLPELPNDSDEAKRQIGTGIAPKPMRLKIKSSLFEEAMSSDSEEEEDTNLETSNDEEAIESGEEPSSGIPICPKRPVNEFILYSNHIRSTIKQDQPGLALGEASKVIANRWKALSNEEKRVWRAKADKLKEKYEKQRAEYEKITKNSTEVSKKLTSRKEAANRLHRMLARQPGSNREDYINKYKEATRMYRENVQAYQAYERARKANKRSSVEKMKAKSATRLKSANAIKQDLKAKRNKQKSGFDTPRPMKMNITPSDEEDDSSKIEAQDESDRPPTPEPALKTTQTRYEESLGGKYSKKQTENHHYLATKAVPAGVEIQTNEVFTPSINGRPSGTSVSFKTNCPLKMTKLSDIIDNRFTVDIFERDPSGIYEIIANNISCDTPIEIIEHAFRHPHLPMISFAHGNQAIGSFDILHTFRIFEREDSDEKELTAIIGHGRNGKIVTIDPRLQIFVSHKTRVPHPILFCTEAYESLDSMIPNEFMITIEMQPTIYVPNKMAMRFIDEQISTADQAFDVAIEVIREEMEDFLSRSQTQSEFDLLTSPEYARLENQEYRMYNKTMLKFVSRHARLLQTLWHHSFINNFDGPESILGRLRMKCPPGYVQSTNQKSIDWFNGMLSDMKKNAFNYEKHLQSEGLDDIAIDEDAFILQAKKLHQIKKQYQPRESNEKTKSKPKRQRSKTPTRDIFPKSTSISQKEGRTYLNKPDRIRPNINRGLMMKTLGNPSPSYDYPPFNQPIRWNFENEDDIEDSDMESKGPLKKKISKRARHEYRRDEQSDGDDYDEYSYSERPKKARRIHSKSPKCVRAAHILSKMGRQETKDYSDEEMIDIMEKQMKGCKLTPQKKNPFESRNFYEVMAEDEDDLNDDEMDEVVDTAARRMTEPDTSDDDIEDDLFGTDEGRDSPRYFRPTTNANAGSKGKKWRAPTPHPKINGKRQYDYRGTRFGDEIRAKNPFDSPATPNTAAESTLIKGMTKVLSKLNDNLTLSRLQTEKKMEQDRIAQEEKEEDKISNTTRTTVLNTGTQDGVNPAKELTPENKQILRAKPREVPKIMRKEMTARGAKCQPCPNIYQAINSGDYARERPMEPGQLTIFGLPMNQNKTELKGFDYDKTQYEYENGMDITAKQRYQLTSVILCLPMTVFYLIEATKSLTILMEILFGDESLLFYAALCWYRYVDTNSQTILDMQMGGHDHLPVKIAWQIDSTFSAFFAAAQRGVPQKELLECTGIQQNILQGNYTIIVGKTIQDALSKRNKGKNNNKRNNETTTGAGTTRDNNSNNEDKKPRPHANQPEALKCSRQFYSKVIGGAISKHSFKMPMHNGMSECARYAYRGFCYDDCNRAKNHKPVTDRNREERLVKAKKDCLEIYKKNKRAEDPDFQ